MSTSDPDEFIRLPPLRSNRFHLAYGALSFLMGLALILGGPTRVSAHAYQLLIAQGGPNVWGAALLVIGVVLILSMDHSKLTGFMLLAGGVVYWLWTFMFFWAAVTFNDANLTAVVAYAWIGTGHLCAFSKLRRAQLRRDARS